MKPLFPIHPHPNDPKTKKLFILLSPLYPYHAYCLCSPQTGAKIIADIQLGSSLMIIESAKSDNKGEERGKTAMHCSLHCSLMCCTVWWTSLHLQCAALYMNCIVNALHCNVLNLIPTYSAEMHWNAQQHIKDRMGKCSPLCWALEMFEMPKLNQEHHQSL